MILASPASHVDVPAAASEDAMRMEALVSVDFSPNGTKARVQERVSKLRTDTVKAFFRIGSRSLCCRCSLS